MERMVSPFVVPRMAKLLAEDLLLLPYLEMSAGDMAQLVERLPCRLGKSWKVHKISLVAVCSVELRGTTIEGVLHLFH